MRYDALDAKIRAAEDQKKKFKPTNAEEKGNLFTGALSERLDNKKLVFELNEGSLNLRIF